MNLSPETRVYTPEPAPRSGEGNAWILTFLVFIIWLFLRLSNQPVTGSVTFFLGFLFLASALISFGNWVDRRTVITMDGKGVDFRNGIRRVSMAWDEIEEVRVKPAVWGKRVQVLGHNKRFDFHTSGEVKYKGAVKARTGFLQGEEMVRLIVLNSGLRIAETLGDVYTYTRQ